VITARAKIHVTGEASPIVPIVIPDLTEVRAFAVRLHKEGKPWQGDVFGWSAEYNPQKAEAPLESKLTFTPADFVIGESGIWFFSLMWEQGKDAPPVEFLDNTNILP
jgi:hypothetical protein